MASDFVTKDSGEREHFDSGMQRDTEAGKPRFDLIVPEGVPFEDQLLTRFAALMGRGAEKYDARNWEQANGAAEVARARSSAFRHFFQWFCGETDEDHAAATLFNIMVVETIGPRVEAGEEYDYAAVADQILGEKGVHSPAARQWSREPVTFVSPQPPSPPPAAGSMQIHVHAIDEKARRLIQDDINDAMNRARRQGGLY